MPIRPCWEEGRTHENPALRKQITLWYPDEGAVQSIYIYACKLLGRSQGINSLNRLPPHLTHFKIPPHITHFKIPSRLKYRLCVGCINVFQLNYNYRQIHKYRYGISNNLLYYICISFGRNLNNWAILLHNKIKKFLNVRQKLGTRNVF